MKAADGRHLRDDQMIAVYIGAEPRFGRQDHNLGHLRGCARCAQRYQAFVDQMTDVRDEATAEADAIFTPARLEAQRLQILHRLEHASHPARVIQFPSHGVQNLSIFTGTQVRRWIAAAAGFAIAIAALGGTLAQGRATAAALEGISRNPGAAAKITTPMILGLALIESLVLFALVIAWVLQSRIAL